MSPIASVSLSLRDSRAISPVSGRVGSASERSERAANPMRSERRPISHFRAPTRAGSRALPLGVALARNKNSWARGDARHMSVETLHLGSSTDLSPADALRQDPEKYSSAFQLRKNRERFDENNFTPTQILGYSSDLSEDPMDESFRAYEFAEPNPSPCIARASGAAPRT